MRNTFMGTIALAAVTALGAGCAAQTVGYAEVDAPVVFTAEPTLVAVEPDVWVVRDYDDSVYYVDGSYWVYRRDRWYQSRSYDRGWVIVDVNVIPPKIRGRDHRAYAHYHGSANAPVRNAPRERLASAPDGDPHRRAPERAAPHMTPPPGQDRNGPAERAVPPRGAAQPERRPDVGPPPRGQADDNRKREDGKKGDKKNDDHRKR